MALLKRVQAVPEPESLGSEPLSGPDPSAALLAALHEASPAQRRLAARGLASHPQHWAELLACLNQEADQTVREAIFCSLETLCGLQEASGPATSQAIVDGLIELLHSDDAALRNGAIEVLQTQAPYTGERIDQLLQDPDSDLRIFALDILQTLAHPKAPQWLRQVLEQETHPNVLGTAIDRATDIGDESMKAALLRLRPSVAETPYLVFAIDIALKRIEAQTDNDKVDTRIHE